MAFRSSFEAYSVKLHNFDDLNDAFIKIIKYIAKESLKLANQDSRKCFRLDDLKIIFKKVFIGDTQMYMLENFNKLEAKNIEKSKFSTNNIKKLCPDFLSGKEVELLSFCFETLFLLMKEVSKTLELDELFLDSEFSYTFKLCNV